MQFPVEQLKSRLDQTILPAYLLYGEEPQQLTEALDLIRAATFSKGFSERVTLFAESSFDWTMLRSALEVSPLFAEKTVVDCRLSGNQPDKTGVAILEDYLAHPCADIVLLLSTQKLSKTAARSNWLKQIKSLGLVQQFKPLSGKLLLDWLIQRAQQKGLNIDPGCIHLLAARVEGNLLAAAQEIDKLYLDFGQKQLSSADIEQWVSDQSRYDVFAWVECTLEGKLSRSQRILQRMKLEDISPVLMVWAMARELRLLVKLSESGNKAGYSALEKAGVWGNRKQIIQRALVRLDYSRLLKALAYCHSIDSIVKGAEPGDPWQGLSEICAMIALAPQQAVPIETRDQFYSGR